MSVVTEGLRAQKEANMSTILATRYSRSQYEPGFEAAENRRFGSLQAAKMWAEQVLGTVTTTRDCYWRDAARADSVKFTRVGKARPYRTRFYQPLRPSTAAGSQSPHLALVPSVGELGYW
jgi:hypothetical protein